VQQIASIAMHATIFVTSHLFPFPSIFKAITIIGSETMVPGVDEAKFELQEVVASAHRFRLLR
jgi:hypothetical protein